MRVVLALAAFAAGLLASGQGDAQTVRAPAGYAPAQSIGFGTPGAGFTPVTPATPLPVASRQEVFALATANAPAAAVTVYGGDYVLGQGCTAYGTLALQTLGADGATWQTIVSRTTTDTAGGTGLALGSNAQVKLVLSGTSGCVAQLSRVP